MDTYQTCFSFHIILLFTQELKKTLEAKEEEIQIYEEQLKALSSDTKNKDNRITELEGELSELHVYLDAVKCELEEIKTKVEDKDKLAWVKVNEEKDKKIERLENEVRKQSINLQGIVNTELWEKNREIEKLQNRLTEKLKVKDVEINKLEKELIGKDMQLKILKDKIEELGIHVNLPSSLLTLKLEDSTEFPEEMGALKEKLKLTNERVKYLQKTVEELTQQLRNTPERESENKYIQLKSEYSRLQQEFDKSEKCRIEMGNVCILLTNRLEELANFLDSLLKHKSVLGLLGIKQQSAIKHAIDQSLDLSKTFNISLISEDKSLAQLSSLTGFLNNTMNTTENISMLDIEEFDEQRPSISNQNNISLTYNSHLSQQKGETQNSLQVIDKQNEIISVLRQQIETMKKEIELRDTEIAHQHVNSTDVEKSLKNDQDLVEAIIDLQVKSNKSSLDVLSPGKIYQTLLDKGSPSKTVSIDNQSESEAWSEPDRNVSQARIGLDAESLKSCNVSSLRTKSSKHSTGDSLTGSTEDDYNRSSSRTPSKRNSAEKMVNILQDTIGGLENKLREKENELLTLQCKIMDNDNKMKETQIKLHEELDQVRKDKAEVENILRATEKIVQSLENKVQELEEKFTTINKEKEDIFVNMKLKDDEIKSLTEKSSSFEVVKSDNEQMRRKLQEAELSLNEITEAKNEVKEKYEKMWNEREHLTQQNDKLEKVCKELEMRAKNLEERELDLTKKLQESERDNREKILALKRELNEYALKTSQIVLERTKLNNEKLRVEQELRRTEARETEKEAEFTEKEKQYLSIKNNIQKQLSQLELQKSHLQLKITELETTNVELQNRILRLQAGDNANCTKSTPTSPIKISDMPNIHHLGKHSLGSRFHFGRQRSDMSGYNSEDVLTDDNDGVLNRSAPEVAHAHWFHNVNHNVAEAAEARNMENSSPDLGIESDPGRFSSLETNVSRPLLQTLELTASMNNLLSDNHNEATGQCKLIIHFLSSFSFVNNLKISRGIGPVLDRFKVTRSAFSILFPVTDVTSVISAVKAV